MTDKQSAAKQYSKKQFPEKPYPMQSASSTPNKTRSKTHKNMNARPPQSAPRNRAGNYNNGHPRQHRDRKVSTGRRRKASNAMPGRKGSSTRHRSNKTKTSSFINKVPTHIGDKYVVNCEIGKGAFGRVYKCLDNQLLRFVAIKTVSTKNLNAEQMKDVEREVDLLADLPAHQNIVRYIETVRDTNFFCIVLEYVENGSLHTFMKSIKATTKNSNECLPETAVASFVAQILCGLSFLHEQGIIHRDIKAANILITNDGVAKLADFGVAAKADEGQQIGDEEVAGSPYWMAPEIIEMRGQLTPKCDIWAVGATAIELFTGHPPYHNLQTMSALFRIVQDPHPEIPARASQGFQSFLFSCFCKDPAMRLSAVKLQQDPWLKHHIVNKEAPPVAKATTTVTVTESPAVNNDDEKKDGTITDVKSFLDLTTRMSRNILDAELQKKRQASRTNTASNTPRHSGAGKSLKINKPRREKTPKPKKQKDKSTKEKNEKAKAKAKAKETDDSSSDWGSSDESSSEETSSSGSSDSEESTAEESEFGSGLSLDLERYAKNFEQADDESEFSSSDEDDDVGWEISEDEQAGVGNNFENNNNNELTSVNRLFKKLDEALTHIIFNRDEKHSIHKVTVEQEKEICSRFQELDELFIAQPILISQCIKLAVIPIMEMLSLQNVAITCAALKTVRIIIGHDTLGNEFLQTLCLIQLIPAIGDMVHKSRSLQIKTAAANFLKRFCVKTEDLNQIKKKSKKKKVQTEIAITKMFIAAGGVRILVQCLHNKYNNENKPIIFIAVECIHNIYFGKIHSKRDLGRMFTKARLLKFIIARLGDVLMDIDDMDKAVRYGEMMAEIIHKIAELTDQVVKTRIAGLFDTKKQFKNNYHDVPRHMSALSGNDAGRMTELANQGAAAFGMKTISERSNRNTPSPILIELTGLLMSMENDASEDSKKKFILIRLLKSFVELSKDSQCIPALIKASAMSTVMLFLKSNEEKIQTQVIMFLWNMTRIANTSSAAQARMEAAQSGAIPVLKQLIKQDHHKSLLFLVESICKFPVSANKSTLFELKKHDMVQFYVDMTKSGHGISHIDALRALASWMDHGEKHVARLEFVLCQPDNVTQLIRVFRQPVAQRKGRNKSNIQPILNAFNTLTQKSRRIADTLGNSQVFLTALGDWFITLTDKTDAFLLINLLRMVTSMFNKLNSAVSKKKFAKTILPILDKVFKTAKENNKQLVINQLSKKLLPKIVLFVDPTDTEPLSLDLKRALNPSSTGGSAMSSLSSVGSGNITIAGMNTGNNINTVNNIISRGNNRSVAHKMMNAGRMNVGSPVNTTLNMTRDASATIINPEHENMITFLDEHD